MRTSYKPQFEQVNLENKALQKKNLELDTQIQALELEKGNREIYIANLVEVSATDVMDREGKITAISAELEESHQKLHEARSRIDRMELSKMATAYKEQKEEYEGDIKLWRWWLLGSVFLLAAATSVSVYLAHSRPWHERFEFYLVDFIFISTVWFVASRYSHYSKLRDDFANRQTLAQTYHNILLSLGTEPESPEAESAKVTKNLFMGKAVDVLCAPSVRESKEPILSKELIKQITDLVKSLSTR